MSTEAARARRLRRRKAARLRAARRETHAVLINQVAGPDVRAVIDRRELSSPWPGLRHRVAQAVDEKRGRRL